MKFPIKSLTLCFLISLVHAAPAQVDYSSCEQFQYQGPGLKQVGWLATRHSREIGSSSWSVGCETLDRDYGKFSAYQEHVGELGVKRGRLQSGWAKCEQEKGRYAFEWLDESVYGLKEQGVDPWICLCYGNPLYASDIRLGAKIFTDETTMQAWLNYVTATVTRYKDVVTEWEVWNEPNSGNSSEAYANLLMKTSEAIRAVQPDATIIGFALCMVDLDFAEGVLEVLKAEDRLNTVDFISYHPYHHNPDDSYERVEKLQALAASYSPDLKLFQGENGCPAALEWAHAMPNYPWTEVSQAKYLMRRMAGDFVRGIPTSIFTIIDLKYYNMLQSFGLIRSNLLREVVYRRPSYYGVRNMVNFLDDSVTPIGLLDHKSKAYRPLTVAGFEKAGQPVALYWYGDRIPDDELEWDLVDLTIRDLNFQDPVLVEMVSGKVFELDDGDWENSGDDVCFRILPAWDSVLMLAERAVVEMQETPPQ